MTRLLTLALLLALLSGCNPDSLLQPSERQFYSSFVSGGSLEWDETIIDSFDLPPGLVSAPLQNRLSFIAKEQRDAHYTISVPDTSIKKFWIEKEVLVAAPSDTLATTAQQVWRTTTYGSSYQEYDKNNALIRTTTLPLVTEDADFTTLPMDCSPAIAVTDSIRDLFEIGAANDGFTVTDLGSSGYKLEQSHTESSQTYAITAWHNRTNLLMDSSMVILPTGRTMTSHYEYEELGGYWVATRIEEISDNYLDPSTVTALASQFSSFDLTNSVTSRYRRITTLSNIQLP